MLTPTVTYLGAGQMRRPCLGAHGNPCPTGALVTKPMTRCPSCLALQPTRTGSTRAWRELRKSILYRDGYRCTERVDGYRCTETDLTSVLHVDHIKPKALGGSDHPSNLRTLCERHNLAKGARELS